ncbi:MAG: winged helix-turn-helix transcriptional regulator [Burkholderiales bacterium]|nr:winged helix-turn-helix transcriptional regulator [Burkholderiales bacterium]
MSPTAPIPAARSAVGGCTCSKLRRLTRRVTAVYDRALSPVGMRVTQYSLLSNLRGVEGVPVSRLAQSLDMDRTTLTRNLKPLLQVGWVALEPSPDDARVRLVLLTPTGAEQWRAARSYWQSAQQEVTATIGASALAGLHTMLDEYVPLFRPVTGNEGEPE